MKKGSYYKFTDRGQEFVGQYMGREKGWECCICEKGNNAHCFNVFDSLEKYQNGMYETFSYGTDHLPKLIEIKKEDLK